MRKYYLKENVKKGFNAGSKALLDVNAILEKNGYIPVPFDFMRKKINKILHLGTVRNRNTFSKLFHEKDDNTILVIQYPFYLDEKSSGIMRGLLEKYKEKSSYKIVTVVHDLNSLRAHVNDTDNLEEESVFQLSDVVVVHNDKMKDYVEKTYDCSSTHLITLSLFDYLCELRQEVKKHSDEICIAGNLDPKKVGYIYKLGSLSESINFSLYGVGYEDEHISNLKYKGKYTPEELPNHLEGSWGLVWDGDDIETCTGIPGNYLRWNNPHKTSLYLVSKRPVIVWKQSALAEYIVNKHLGIAVESIEEIPNAIHAVSSKDMNLIMQNVEKVSHQLESGYYLRSAVQKAEEYLKQNK